MKYRRKPEVVDARQVTPENTAEVAAWCGGVVAADGSVGVWTVDGHAYAERGEWLVRTCNGLRCYDDAAFRLEFEPVPEPPSEDDLRNLLVDTFGPEHVGPETFDGAAPEWVRLLRQELSGGIARTLPGILRAAYGIVAYDDDANRLIEAWRKREDQP